MINLQEISDKFAISLSALCAIHCLLIPVLVVMTPSIAALNLQDEIFHIWMIVAVVPISAYALTMGCKNHKNIIVMLLGVMGLLILVLTAVLGHDFLTENLEKLFTVLGALLITIAHVWNYHLCRKHVPSCECSA